MRIDRHQLLASAAVLGLALATPGAAQADTFAQSILIINNFRLSHASGTPFAVDEFGGPGGASNAHALSQLNGTRAGANATVPVLSGASPDVARQLVGSADPAVGENYFLQFGAPPALPGSFAYADQYLAGNPVSSAAAGAGALSMTRADAALNVRGQADGSGGVTSTFGFTIAAGETLTISFDATPFTQAMLSSSSGSAASASARLAWSVSIVDMSKGLDVFSFAPEQLNAQSQVGRGVAEPGTSRYDPGTLTFSATTPFLDPNRTYQMTIQHATLANAMQLAGAVLPEPGSLALLGLGLLGLAALRRKK